MQPYAHKRTLHSVCHNHKSKTDLEFFLCLCLFFAVRVPKVLKKSFLRSKMLYCKQQR